VKKTKELGEALDSFQKSLKAAKEGLEILGEVLEGLDEEEEEEEEEETEPPPRSRKKAGRKKKGRKPKKAAGRKKKKPGLDDVREAFVAVIEEYGDEGAEAVLKPFDVTKVSELDPDDFEDAIAAAQKYLEEDEED
jgi:hypothetical protein